MKLNSDEPPRYGSVCQVVWEGWCREAPPYPDHFIIDYVEHLSAYGATIFITKDVGFSLGPKGPGTLFLTCGKLCK
jgi:hypothetical protein